MNKSPAEILQFYLISQDIFSSPSSKENWPLFITTLPTGKGLDDIGCISDTTSVKDGRLMSGPNILHYGIQARTRSRTFEDGWKKMQEITSVLELVNNLSIVIDVDNIYILQNISQGSSVLPMGQDPETRLFLFSVNFITTIKES